MPIWIYRLLNWKSLESTLSSDNLIGLSNLPVNHSSAGLKGDLAILEIERPSLTLDWNASKDNDTIRLFDQIVRPWIISWVVVVVFRSFCAWLQYKVEDGRDHPDRFEIPCRCRFNLRTRDDERRRRLLCLSVCQYVAPRDPSFCTYLGSDAIQCAHLDGTKCGLPLSISIGQRIFS